MPIDNKALQAKVKAVWAGLNSGDIGVLKDLLAPNYELNGQPFTYEQTKEWLQGLMQQFDVKFDVQNVFGEEDKVCIRWYLYLTSKTDDKTVEGMGTNVLIFDDNEQCTFNWQAGATSLEDFHPVPTPGSG